MDLHRDMDIRIMDLDLVSNVAMVHFFPTLAGSVMACAIVLRMGEGMRMRPTVEITIVLLCMVVRIIRTTLHLDMIMDLHLGMDMIMDLHLGMDMIMDLHLDMDMIMDLPPDMDIRIMDLDLVSNVAMVHFFPTLAGSVMACAIVLRMGEVMRMRPTVEIMKVITLIGMAAKDMWIHIQEQTILDLGMML